MSDFGNSPKASHVDQITMATTHGILSNLKLSGPGIAGTLANTLQTDIYIQDPATCWTPGYVHDQDPRTWCPSCSAKAGKFHELDCVQYQPDLRWTGPKDVNPGYIMCALVEGDTRIPAWSSCAHCKAGFLAGDRVMLGTGGAPPFHVSCMQLLAASIPDPDEVVNAQYEAMRSQLLRDR